MFRIFVVVVLVRLFAQSAGVDLVMGETCAEPCDASEQGGEGCAPSCQDCLCCSHHRVVTLPPSLQLAPVGVGTTEHAPLTEPVALVRADEILKVPRRGFSA